MSFLGTKELTQLLKTSNIITPFDESKIKNGAYELSLGDQVFQTGSKPRVVKNLAKKEKIYIEPGQFALLLTDEKINMPGDKIAFISIKASIKFNGLVNVSGFHVDPGFPGKLLFSVYNAGPSTIILSQGTSYFPIWFARLGETQEYQGSHNGQADIPDDAVKALSQGDIASPNELSKRIDEVKHLKTKIEWVLLAILAFVTALTVKVWTDHSKIKEAVEFGYQRKTDEHSSDSININLRLQIDTLKVKLDSTLKLLGPVKIIKRNK